jgi:deoxyuridine 5'-triphosphate nucleotidohydrolase
MKETLIKLKKIHADAKMPIYSSIQAACADIYAVEDKIIPAKGDNVVDVGLQVAYIHPDYYFTIETRSGMGFKGGIHTHHGRIDSDYRGSLGVKLYNFSNKDFEIKKGDRVAQLEIRENIRASFEFVEEIESTERGEGGFGSTGR